METKQLATGDDIQITGPTTGVYDDTVTEIRVDENPVSLTVKGDMASIPVKQIVRRMDKVFRVFDDQSEKAAN
jgi:putative protease